MRSTRNGLAAILLTVVLAGCGSATATPTAGLPSGPIATAAPTATGTPGASHTATPVSTATETPAPTIKLPTLPPPPTPKPTPAIAATGSLKVARYAHTATFLPDGRVLIVGGVGTGVLSSAELYTAATGSFALTGSMSAKRVGHTATLLANGKVLIVGGNNGTTTLKTAELYDPATGHFTPTGSMSAARLDHTATRLQDGRVLITGGCLAVYGPSRATAEIYDPITGLFTATGSLKQARAAHTATLLGNGKVLIAGGWGPDGKTATKTAELFNPSTGTSALTGSLAHAREGHTATLLVSGKVLIASGGINTDIGSTGILQVASAELFDPAAAHFTAAGSMNLARTGHAATILLSDGRVLVVGGRQDAPYGPMDARSYWKTVELYNTPTNEFFKSGMMTIGRYGVTVTQLANGKVLIAGGSCFQVVGDTLGIMPLKTAELWWQP
jgi:hypothetical protein